MVPSPDSIAPMKLILASASPRRADLLSAAGIPFDAAPAPVDETPFPGEGAEQYALRVARDKARAAAARAQADRPILAADTVVVAGAQMLGKPVDDEDARRMLGLLSGAVHAVHTAVVLLAGGQEAADVVTTRVRFARLSREEIHWYVASGEPAGKAGAYAIQGRGSRFVEHLDGSWSNVVGLPVATVYRMLRIAGVVC